MLFLLSFLFFLVFEILVREQPQSVSPMRYFVEPIVEDVPQGRAPKPSYPCGICIDKLAERLLRVIYVTTGIILGVRESVIPNT